jgi:hypothetical protein
MRIQPFFSRRIGLDDAGNPIPIDAGGRYVYRSKKRNFGTLLMRQRSNDITPGTNFFVGRYSENIGQQSRIGGIMTVKNNDSGTNVVAAVDGFFRLGESHSLSTMLIRSSNNNGGKNGFSGYAQYYFTNTQFKIWWTNCSDPRFDPAMGFGPATMIGTTGIFWYYRKSYHSKWVRLLTDSCRSFITRPPPES